MKITTNLLKQLIRQELLKEASREDLEFLRDVRYSKKLTPADQASVRALYQQAQQADDVITMQYIEDMDINLEEPHPSEETIRRDLSHIKGSKSDTFVQAIVDISTLMYKVSNSADPGMAFDDSGDDLDRRDRDYAAWNDQLRQVEYDPVYRKAVKDLIGLNITTEDGREMPIINVGMHGGGWEAETAVYIRFGKSGGRRTLQRPIFVDEMGVSQSTVQEITEVN